MLTIARIDSFDELLKLEPQWNELLKKSDTNTIFLTFEWITNWWKCFAHDKQLFVLVVKENEDIIGIAPLMITASKKAGITLKKLEFIGMPLSDYSDMMIRESHEQVLQKIYSYLLEHKNLWSFIKLTHIPETSSTLHYARHLMQPKKLSFILPSDICPTHIFDDGWASFKKKINNKKMRKAIRFFKDQGGLSLGGTGGDVQEALRLLELFFEQHKKRWNNTSTPSMFNDENYKTFFRSLITSLLDKGMLDLFYLSLNQKPIAFQFSFLYNNKYLAYNTVYDSAYAPQSPGRILHKFLLEQCASQNLTEFDFLRGYEKYKLQFTNKTKKNFSISIHKNTFLCILGYLSNKIENKIKESDRLYNFFIKYEKKLRIF